MKIGLCGNVKDAAAVAAAGFDYLELSMNGLAAMSEEEFAAAVKTLRAAGIATTSTNCMFPGSIQLMDEATPDETILSYLRLAMGRARQIGVTTAVFGSGGCRRRPEGMSFAKAWKRLVYVTGLIGKVAEETGLTVAIEPLNRSETNMINTVAEGAILAADVACPAVKVLADYYHVTRDPEPIDDAVRVGGVAHVHIATAGGRKIPTAAEPGFTEFFRALKAASYTGNISVEGGVSDLAGQGPVSVRLLKELWEKA